MLNQILTGSKRWKETRPLGLLSDIFPYLNREREWPHAGKQKQWEGFPTFCWLPINFVCEKLSGSTINHDQMTASDHGNTAATNLGIQLVWWALIFQFHWNNGPWILDTFFKLSHLGYLASKIVASCWTIFGQLRVTNKQKSFSDYSYITTII